MFNHVSGTVGRWLEAGVPDSEIAVLARTNDQVTSLATHLRSQGILAHEEGLPHLATTHAFEVLKRTMGDGTTLDLESDEFLLEGFDRIGASGEVVAALVGSDPDESAENLADWGRLRSAVDDMERKGKNDWTSVIGAIQSNDDGPRSRAGVTVTTMTRSKGLEWDAVAATHLGADAMMEKFV